MTIWTRTASRFWSGTVSGSPADAIARATRLRTRSVVETNAAKSRTGDGPA
jgi:hypothetical protein